MELGLSKRSIALIKRAMAKENWKTKKHTHQNKQTNMNWLSSGAAPVFFLVRMAKCLARPVLTEIYNGCRGISSSTCMHDKQRKTATERENHWEGAIAPPASRGAAPGFHDFQLPGMVLVVESFIHRGVIHRSNDYAHEQRKPYGGIKKRWRNQYYECCVLTILYQYDSSSPGLQLFS